VEILSERSIQCLPGYLSNVGGVLASSLHDLGVSRSDIEAMFATEYRAVVSGILEQAVRHRTAATEIAASLARGHMVQRQAFPHRSLPRRVYDRFLRSRLPASWRARTAHRTFLHRFRALREEVARLELSG
jgi:hypothetical protein